MLQKFNDNTVLCRYIKNLVGSVGLPTRKLLFDGDIVYAGCEYYYNGRIFHCQETGMFVGITGSYNRLGYLTVNDHLESSDKLPMLVMSKNRGKTPLTSPFQQSLTVTDEIVDLELYEPAEVECVSKTNCDLRIEQCSNFFKSNTPYYDAVTHKKLGDYLRLLKNEKKLDLMPLYNCCPGSSTTTVGIEGKDIVENLTHNIVYIVPIKFDIDYTVVMDCSFPITLKPIFYDEGVLVDSKNNIPYWKYLDESATVHYNYSTSSRPFTYRLTPSQCSAVKGTEYSDLHKMERYLCLLIQLPFNCNKCPVVLEGDYTHNASSTVNDISFLSDAHKTTSMLDRSMVSALSLVSEYDGTYRPFSDKLVEYLLHNTIDLRDTNEQNIAYVRKMTNCLSENPGEWDRTLRYTIFKKYLQLSDKHPQLNYYDILGYVDSDVENALRKGYLRT